MKTWMRGRSASRTASQAASMSAACARARPATIGGATGPSPTGSTTVRAIVWTASKSPGEVIGKPASITSTPSRASCWAISSFSAVFSEMPGDCSPSRRVVSKIRTSFVLLSSMSSLLFFRLSLVSALLGMRLRGRHALFPPKGEEQKKSASLRRRHASIEASTRRIGAPRARAQASSRRAAPRPTSRDGLTGVCGQRYESARRAAGSPSGAR